jgi:hypothetical protein
VQVDEGVHKEQSPSYHFYIRDMVKRLNEQAGIGGERLAVLVRKLDAAAGWMLMPDGTMTPFGDTDLEEAPAFARESADTADGLQRSWKRATRLCDGRAPIWG